MTAKTMEDVLMDHQRQNSSSCLCGWAELGRSHPAHQAAALSAAGFGLVADAKREALEEAAEECAKTSSNILNNNHNLNPLWDGLADGWKRAAVRFRARAAEMRQP